MTFETIPTERPSTPLLDSVPDPDHLRQLSRDQLEPLAEELRHFLLYTVGQTGGHFGAGLGVVELTIALHYAFNTPEDDLIWDVGHQTYPHKILTGRRESMQSLRQAGGIAPFPSRDESRFDVFGTGHSSTSISAALGIQLANEINKRESQTVVVIGDGAMTAGMAFEALNHVAACQANLLIILNDNAMSISENVGGLANYFARNISAHHLTSAESDGVVPGSIFSDLGLKYSGPVDGHDLDALLSALNQLKAEQGPRLLHVMTSKGKGYGPAEASPVDSHSLTKLEKSGEGGKNHRTYSNLFGEWVCKAAKLDKRLVAVTPAMKSGSDLTRFAEEFPDRFHDVAIAEQHAVTLAAGLAAGGAKPVVAIYSTFLQRAYDQLIHDVAIQNLDVLFVVDRAGLLEDGPTHSGVFDLSFCRSIPNLVLMVPSSETVMTQMLSLGFEHPAPCLVRYPRGSVNEAALPVEQVVFGKATITRQGRRVALLVFGTLLEDAITIADRHDYTVIDMRFLKPLDRNAVINAASDHDLIVTIEENAIAGGAGSGVNELLNQESTGCGILNIGIPDRFIPHDSPAAMQASAGISSNEIEKAIVQRLETLTGKKR
jgi:1-deoxy-D-xylulose-5-phosphate synthase